MNDDAIFHAIRARLAAAGIAGEWATPDRTGNLAAGRGAYIALIRLDQAIEVDAAPLGGNTLPAGTYLYAGSAWGPGGIAARIKRHFRPDKKLHWHVDRLTVQASALAAIAVPDGNECDLVRRLLAMEGIRTALDGFGSTDCRTCRSHLLSLG
ncbi:MAG TPA: GIY-YIG nuclease family protein [Hyphomonas sp.]|nr:GIY-YIG nuclease family protein [Hyphomonas sp.]HPE48680.1 GIY-YIG nuclease family protein [Hyphomonas sp.]